MPSGLGESTGSIALKLGRHVRTPKKAMPSPSPRRSLISTAVQRTESPVSPAAQRAGSAPRQADAAAAAASTARIALLEGEAAEQRIKAETLALEVQALRTASAAASRESTHDSSDAPAHDEDAVTTNASEEQGFAAEQPRAERQTLLGVSAIMQSSPARGQPEGDGGDEVRDAEDPLTTEDENDEHAEDGSADEEGDDGGMDMDSDERSCMAKYVFCVTKKRSLLCCPVGCGRSIESCLVLTWSSWLWMIAMTVWNVAPWVIPFGLFVKSLSFRVEDGVQVAVMALFLVTPILSMRYGGGRNGGLNVTLGDGWNIIFVGMGVMLTISYVQVLLYTFYTDLDFYYNLVPDVVSANGTTAGKDKTNIDVSANFGLAMFRAEMLPKEFNRILQEKWFGRALTAIPPVFLVLLLLVLWLWGCAQKRTLANAFLASELYSASFACWFYSMWLLLLHANYKTDYFSTHNVQISDYDSIAGVSYMTTTLAFLLMSGSVSLQQCSVRQMHDASAQGGQRTLNSQLVKQFSEVVGGWGMLCLIMLFINCFIVTITAYSWTYTPSRLTSGLPLVVGLVLALFYNLTYWYIVIWWGQYLDGSHNLIHNSFIRHAETGTTEAGKKWRGTVSKMIVANRFFKTMVQSKPVEPRKITIREKISSLVNPESPVFYTKQTVLQSVQIVAQTYRIWCILVLASSNRFGMPRWHWVFVAMYSTVVVFHSASSSLGLIFVHKHSTYLTYFIEVLVEVLYIILGFVSSIAFWNLPQHGGLPLCSAFSAHWLSVVVTLLPLFTTLFHIPTVISRATFFKEHVWDHEEETFDDDADSTTEAARAGSMMRTRSKPMRMNNQHFHVPWAPLRILLYTVSLLCSGAAVTMSVKSILMAGSSAGSVVVSPFVAAEDSAGRVSNNLLAFRPASANASALASSELVADETATYLVMDNRTAMRFRGVSVPCVECITTAYVSFKAYDKSSDPAYCLSHGSGTKACSKPTSVEDGVVSISAHKAVHSAANGAWSAAAGAVSALPLTVSNASWTWQGAFGQGGLVERTSDISELLKEVMRQDGWGASSDHEVLLVFGLQSPMMVESAACRAAEGSDSSCFVPKQTLKLDCETPVLSVSYKPTGAEQTLEFSLFRSPTMLELWRDE